MGGMGSLDELLIAESVFELEIEALEKTKAVLDNTFKKILNEIVKCPGKVILCGIGKSGHIARKIAATFASLGTPSFFLHPSDALHGDLGMVSEKDVVILISNSGETQEIINLLPSLKVIGATLIAITSGRMSTLAEECDIAQILPETKEACNLELAPTSSIAAVLVYGDSLAVAASVKYGFGRENFALFHPAGMLGKKTLIRVKDIMAKGDAIPTVLMGCSISEAIMEMSHKTLGVVAVINFQNKLEGLLTDGDLRRAIERKVDMYEDIIDTVMTKNPKYIEDDILAVEALHRLRVHSINNYPVVNERMEVIGLLTWQMIVKAGIVI